MGKSVIHAENLSETSQVYHGITEEAENLLGRRERTRDICKMLKTGERLCILALENQQMIDYVSDAGVAIYLERT